MFVVKFNETPALFINYLMYLSHLDRLVAGIPWLRVLGEDSGTARFVPQHSCASVCDGH